MSKYYYHSLFISEDVAQASDDDRGKLDIELYTDKETYSNVFFAGSGGCCMSTQRDVLDVVQDGDVLSIDGHGMVDRNHVPTGKIGVSPTETITPNQLAKRLKKDGLKNRKILIRLLACYGGGRWSPDLPVNNRRFGSQDSMGKILARSLQYSNVIVEAYKGEVFARSDSKKVKDTVVETEYKETNALHQRIGTEGEYNDENLNFRINACGFQDDGWRWRVYFDSDGNELTHDEVADLGGYGVGNKAR